MRISIVFFLKTEKNVVTGADLFSIAAQPLVVAAIVLVLCAPEVIFASTNSFSSQALHLCLKSQAVRGSVSCPCKASGLGSLDRTKLNEANEVEDCGYVLYAYRIGNL